MAAAHNKLRFLLASGPTRERLDPVRYLSNFSTGTMGKHLAESIRRRGHSLTWVQCPEQAESARDLLGRLQKELPRHDVLVMAAAVCDVRPSAVSSAKIKKGRLGVIRLIENPDVLETLARRKGKRQTFVGFALESVRIRENALGKMKRKKMDLILAQQVTNKIVPFGDASLRAWVFDAKGSCKRFEGARKRLVADYLIRESSRIGLEKLRIAQKRAL